MKVIGNEYLISSNGDNIGIYDGEWLNEITASKRKSIYLIDNG